MHHQFHDFLTENSIMSQNQNNVPQQPLPSGAHVTARVVNLNSDRLCISPKRDHKSENYEDLQMEFNPHVFSSLEQYLPPHVLNLSREVKVRYMRNILLRYFPENDRNRVGVTVTITIIMPPHTVPFMFFQSKFQFYFALDPRSRLFVLPYWCLTRFDVLFQKALFFFPTWKPGE